MAKDVFQEMADKWPSSAVARTEVKPFSGGMLNSKTMANLDSQGLGPERIQVGRKIAYPLGGPKGMVSWLRARTSK